MSWNVFVKSQVASLTLVLFLTGCQENDNGLALGSLERDRIALTATSAQFIVDLPVAEGTLVEAGTVLVRLDDTQQQAEVDRAAAEVSKAAAVLERLRNGAREEELAAARADAAGARAALIETIQTFERAKDLSERGTASKASYDAARASRDAAEASLKSAEEQLRQLVNGARPEDLKAAEADLAAATANLASMEAVLSDLTIIASRTGRLDSLPWNLGERVTVGSPVAVMLADGSPFARVYIPEPYRVKISKGDTLTVRVDGLEDTFEGIVRSISSDPAYTPYYALNQEERARLMYLAEVQLPDSASGLPSGIPAQVVLP
ncbi:HlyD family efflux transporter periplasmic adaptor subunit [Labrenzia sp. CE80]|uniref:HlyD family secretion protein n=1 Tax=Labrenzia sp. CE80 TaxID=1788986 RepID=UPI00129C0D4D|nr:HlyD family efflux transporter periplasmic adaptor subunit [Labrenzia sp. CE80]